MKTKIIQSMLIVIMLAALLSAGGYLNIKRAVLILPHIQVVNVASGYHLNGDPFTETFVVSDPAGVVCWSGASETEAVQVLVNGCP